MYKDKIHSALPPEDNVTRPSAESGFFSAPSPVPVFFRKKWPLIVIAAALITLMICFLPWPSHIELTMSGAEISEDGTVIESGEMIIDAWMYDYLFKPDEFHVKALQVPNREVGCIVRSVLSPLVRDDALDTRFAIFTTWGIEGKNTWFPTQGSLCFTADRCSWVVFLDNRVFVGTTQDETDYSAILAKFHHKNGD